MKRLLLQNLLLGKKIIASDIDWRNEWDGVGGFYEGLAKVKKDGKYGFVNTNGQLVIPCEWDGAGNFYNNFAMVKKYGKYGSVNRDGEHVIPPLFSYTFLKIITNNKEYNYDGNLKDSILIALTEDHRIESHFPHNNSNSATLFYNDEVVLTDNLEAIVNIAEFLGFSE